MENCSRMFLGKVSLMMFSMSLSRCLGWTSTRSPSMPRAKESTCRTMSAPRLALTSMVSRMTLGLRIVRHRLEQLDRHHDRGEDVVQVVRDAAGQRADAFHALRAQELRLDLLSSP